MFVHNLTFASIGELIFGLLALCPLMRRFEREVSVITFVFFFLLYIVGVYFNGYMNI